MSSKIYRIVQGSILLGLGGLLFQKYFSGNLYYYINQRFFYLVTAGAAIFLLLGYVLLAHRKDHSHQHDHDDVHDHDHEHQHGNGQRWSLVIVAIPLFLGFIIPAKPLDANIIQSRGISNEGLFAADQSAVGVELNTPADQRNILDWNRAFNYSKDPQEFAGETADVIGFVYHDPRLSKNQFLVGRLAVTCCVADAFAIGMVVEWPLASETTDNAWVHVRGEVQVVQIDNQTLPLIIAESVKDTDQPSHPYLFP